MLRHRAGRPVQILRSWTCDNANYNDNDDLVGILKCPTNAKGWYTGEVDLENESSKRTSQEQKISRSAYDNFVRQEYYEDIVSGSSKATKGKQNSNVTLNSTEQPKNLTLQLCSDLLPSFSQKKPGRSVKATFGSYINTPTGTTEATMNLRLHWGEDEVSSIFQNLGSYDMDEPNGTNQIMALQQSYSVTHPSETGSVQSDSLLLNKLSSVFSGIQNDQCN